MVRLKYVALGTPRRVDTCVRELSNSGIRLISSISKRGSFDHSEQMEMMACGLTFRKKACWAPKHNSSLSRNTDCNHLFLVYGLKHIRQALPGLTAVTGKFKKHSHKFLGCKAACSNGLTHGRVAQDGLRSSKNTYDHIVVSVIVGCGHCSGEMDLRDGAKRIILMSNMCICMYRHVLTRHISEVMPSSPMNVCRPRLGVQ